MMVLDWMPFFHVSGQPARKDWIEGNAGTLGVRQQHSGLGWFPDFLEQVVAVHGSFCYIF